LIFVVDICFSALTQSRGRRLISRRHSRRSTDCCPGSVAATDSTWDHTQRPHRAPADHTADMTSRSLPLLLNTQSLRLDQYQQSIKNKFPTGWPKNWRL